MSWTFKVATSVAGGSGATTAAIDTTGADLIVVFSGIANGSGSLSDSKSNTWVNIEFSSFQGFWYCQAPTVGSGHTFSVDVGSGNPTGISVAAYSGSATSPLDQHNFTITSGSGGNEQPGSVTPTTSGQLIVTGGMLGTVGGTASIDSGFTLRSSTVGSGGTPWGAGIADIVDSGTNAWNPTWTQTNGSPRAAAIGTFKVASAPPSGNLFRTPLLNGLGGGGPNSFTNPLGRHRQPTYREWMRRDRIFMPRHVYDGQVLEKVA